MPTAAPAPDRLPEVEGLERSGQLLAALDRCRQALVEQPAHADLWFVRGRLCRALDQVQEAEAAFAECLQHHPGNTWAHFSLGGLASSTDRTLAAIAHYQRALACSPDSGEVRITLAAELAKAGWADAAWAVVSPFGDAALPGWWAATRAQIDQTYRQHRQAARQRLRARRGGVPLDAAAVLALGRDLFALGRLGTALRLLQAQMRASPNNFPVFAACADVLARRDGAAAAADFLRSLDWLFGEQAPYRQALARQLYEAGRVQGVAKALQPVSEAAMSHPVRRLLALSWLLAGRSEELQAFSARWMAQTDDVSPYNFAIAAGLQSGRVRLVDEAMLPPAGAGQAQAPQRPAIVQFWDSPAVPADVQQAMASWAAMNPSLRHECFDLARATDFLQRVYGAEVVACFDFCHHPAMKSDLFRVAYLLEHGGVYADADEVCQRSVEPLLAATAQSDLIATLSEGVAPYVHNYFLVAPARSVVLADAFEVLLAGLRKGMRAGKSCDIWHTTGPGLLTRAIARQITHPSPLAGPPLLLAERHYRSYAVTREDLGYKHTAAGNWRLAS